jgi:hypothetical protein
MGVQFAGNILVQSNGGPLPISSGGTGQTTAPAALTALLPSQSGNNGKILTTNGTSASWLSGVLSPGGADTQIQFNDAGSFGANANFVINKSTGAVTSASTFTGTGSIVSGLVETTRALKFQTAGSDRWLMQTTSTAESGSSVGSNFEFVRVADNGATTNLVYTVSRATGAFDFKVTPTVNGGAIGGVVSFNTRTGAITLTSTDVTDALGFTPYNATNPSGYTANAGTVTSVGGTGTVSGLTLTGSVTTSGNLTLGGTLSLTSGDVTTALGFTPLNKAGDTVNGSLTFTAGTVTGLAAPSAGTDATTKNYVDAAIAGLSWKISVRVATTVNITLSGTQTIDGVAVVATNRVLVKNQTTTADNGIYVVSASAWARSADADSAAELDGSAVYVQLGTTQADTGWTETATIATVGTDPIVYAQFSGSGSYAAGTGLSLTGNTFANTGVTSNVAGTNVTVSGATGAVTIGLVAAPTLTGTNFTGIPNAGLTNSSVTVNGTAIALGASGTVTAAAGTLTGTTLAAGVTASSLTSVGTLTSLAVTGVSTTSAVSISGVGLLFSYTLTTSATTAGQVVGTSAIATYRSVKYNISITSGSSYQYTEVTAIHDGTNVYITENCTLTTGSTLATFTADISGGNMRLLTTPINAVTAYKVVSVHIAV